VGTRKGGRRSKSRRDLTGLKEQCVQAITACKQGCSNSRKKKKERGTSGKRAGY